MADTASDEQLFRFAFTGRATEYFRIWIISLCLSLATLGVYSAWGKVRKKRYLYAHTALDGTGFDYRASPLAIYHRASPLRCDAFCDRPRDSLLLSNVLARWPYRLRGRGCRRLRNQRGCGRTRSVARGNPVSRVGVFELYLCVRVHSLAHA